MSEGDLADRINKLEQINKIRNLIDMYHWKVDHFDWDGWVECFTEDAVWEMPNLFGTLCGRKEIRDTCKDAMDHAYDEIQHAMVNVYVELTSDEEAIGHGNLLFAAVPNRNKPEDAFRAGGRYTWAFVRTNDGWKISKSKFVFLWNAGNDAASLLPDAPLEETV